MGASTIAVTVSPAMRKAVLLYASDHKVSVSRAATELLAKATGESAGPLRPRGRPKKVKI